MNDDGKIVHGNEANRPFFEHQSDHVSIETHGDLGMPHDLNKTQRLAGKPLNTNWPC